MHDGRTAHYRSTAHRGRHRQQGMSRRDDGPGFGDWQDRRHGHCGRCRNGGTCEDQGQSAADY